MRSQPRATAGTASSWPGSTPTSSSRALESGDYAEAIDEADLALQTGAGHRFFSALALANKAEAHLRLGQLDDARAAVADAAAICEALGTLIASIPQILYGELYRQRGDMVRARGSFERARALAEEGDDVHTLVSALCGLARVLAEDDLAAARKMAADGMARASGLERAAALCAAAEVELRAGDGARPRGTPGRPRLRHAPPATVPPWRSRWSCRARPASPGDAGAASLGDRAVGRRRESGRRRAGPARARPAVRRSATAEATRRSWRRWGRRRRSAYPACWRRSRAAGVRSRSSPSAASPCCGQASPSRWPAWQSRKARDLLKVLVARRGHPITRDAAAETMWPEEDPEPLGNRLSVALSTIRKVLDPRRRHPPDHYVVADARTIALRLDHVDVDLIEFLRIADRAIDLMAKGDRDAAEAPLRQALPDLRR